MFFSTVVYASAVNPYTNVAHVYLQCKEQVMYIKDRTDKIFAAAAIDTRQPLLNGDYEVPNGWNRELLNIDGVAVEKYAPKEITSDRVVLFMHGGVTLVDYIIVIVIGEFIKENLLVKLLYWH